jgi:aryl-alcohol dehydrogenase-like predicted oxidoreductase
LTARQKARPFRTPDAADITRLHGLHASSVRERRTAPPARASDVAAHPFADASPTTAGTDYRCGMVNYRFLGRSGLKISEITYGNWLTHGSQVENDTALACVRAALDVGITTFDTADAYANTKAETVLGEALKGERRQSLEIFTKVFWPTGPGGPNDSGLSRKHIFESIDGSLSRLQTDYVDLYQAHRYDVTTPLEETMQAFADVVRAGKALYIGVSEWTADQIRAGHALAKELGVQLISNQPQYSALWRVIETEVVPASKELGISQIVWSPVAQGILTGKYAPGAPVPAGSRGADDKGGAQMIQRFLDRPDVLQRVQGLRPIADELGLTLAQLAVAWVLQNDNVAAALIGASRPEQVRENVKASGVTIPTELLTRIDDVLGDSVVSDPAETAKNSPVLR